MLGEPGAARLAAAEAVSGIRRGQGFWTPGCYAALARAQLALDEPAADITATLDEYADLLTRTGFALLEGELHELRAELARREGLRDEEIAALHRSHACYLQFGMTTQAARMQALIDAGSTVG
jgi:hypothetical protein